MNLTKHFTEDPYEVRKFSPDKAWVLFNPFALALVPASPRQLSGIDAPSSRILEAFDRFYKAKAVRSRSISLGKLLLWAARSRGDGPDAADHQKILGVPFDRRWLGELLRWPMHERLAASIRVRLELVPVTKHHLLRVSCGGFQAFLACCKRDTKCGKDPLRSANGR